MPISDASHDPATRSFPYPVSEELSRYFALTAPGTSSAPAPSSPPQLEDLWDTVGDFA